MMYDADSADTILAGAAFLMMMFVAMIVLMHVAVFMFMMMFMPVLMFMLMFMICGDQPFPYISDVASVMAVAMFFFGHGLFIVFLHDMSSG